MKIWLTIEPTKEEISRSLETKSEEVSKTPLKTLIEQSYLLMITGHEVTLKITNRKYQHE